MVINNVRSVLDVEQRFLRIGSVNYDFIKFSLIFTHYAGSCNVKEPF